MTISNPIQPGSGGGSLAIRGFLVQTLVALLEVAKSECSFTEIMLEPAVGDNQFDSLWKNKDGSFATQVKPTVNSFTKTDVEKWAERLRKARTDEKCTLVLVGHIPPSLVGLPPPRRRSRRRQARHPQRHPSEPRFTPLTYA
jgi:hypothetical protein